MTHYATIEYRQLLKEAICLYFKSYYVDDMPLLIKVCEVKDILPEHIYVLAAGDLTHNRATYRVPGGLRQYPQNTLERCENLLKREDRGERWAQIASNLTTLLPVDLEAFPKLSSGISVIYTHDVPPKSWPIGYVDLVTYVLQHGLPTQVESRYPRFVWLTDLSQNFRGFVGFCDRCLPLLVKTKLEQEAVLRLVFGPAVTAHLKNFRRMVAVYENGARAFQTLLKTKIPCEDRSLWGVSSENPYAPTQP